MSTKGKTAQSTFSLNSVKVELAIERPVLGLRQLAWRRFRRHRLALASVVILALLILSAVFAPWIATSDPYKANVRTVREPPSREHPLGYDDAGRDNFARLLLGGRVSLSVGLISTSIYISIGVVLGALSGYRGGATDFSIMRITDAMMCFPTFFLILAVTPLIGRSIFNVMIIIGIFGWTGITRLVRGEILSLRQRDFVLAARCVGATDRGLIFRHLLPNVVGPLIVAATFGIAGGIMSEAGLSFLGLGVQPPQSSWGNMLGAAANASNLEKRLWMWAPPGVMIALTTLCINFIGDGLRDALDPRVVLD